ncbi:hypothetical protein GGS24DRAFT_456716 [Hypoxylon argillaceum]|nr:hypothetical protein GGS24DRAFT_456716 [Hypoxylon argillaceum]KAI1155308.1 hypothetical protein F4825DRAFT_408117 [Nemania diffusa]
MYSPKVLLFIAAFAGTSLSQKSDAEYCSSKMSSFFSWVVAEGPTTPAAVLAFLATQTNSKPPLSTFGPEAHGEEICSIYSELPDSLKPQLKTYITSVLSFGNANSEVLLDVATDCVPENQVASVTSYIHAMLTPSGDGCDPTPTPGSAANGTYPTSPAPTATASYTGQSNYTYPTSVVTAAAARPTGVWLGAAAIGGILGAAAML